MSFENGLYAIRFQTPLGAGAGVAYLENGKLRGGDSMMAYVGSFNETGGVLTADARPRPDARVRGTAKINASQTRFRGPP